MSNKSAVFWGMIIGSTVGGYLPSFFGVDVFSMLSLLGSFLGGILGIWIAYRYL
ncbi:MAG: hypothetical protein NT099_03240 [Candidatus Saganbacteria bacterium]|nr:hypothetical protein [Candidatus Saganbacteria bacterium]